MAQKNRVTEQKPTKINGIEDADAVAAMAPETIKATKPKPQPRTSKKSTKSSKQKSNHPKAKITFRHNVLPPIIGIFAFLGVLGLLNAEWVVARYQYHFSSPASAASFSADASNTDPDAPARIYIPEIGVDAPIVTDEKTYNPDKVQTAMQRGTVQYGASADPGQKGNIVILGHSSGQLWAPGEYKFVFTLLDKLENDDRIIIDFKGKRYIYRVSSEQVVQPTEINVLQHTKEPQLTLITCTPVGTSRNRLVITARQVSPKPETATVIDPQTQRAVTTSTIPR